MKKVIALLLVLCLALSMFAGCGTEKKDLEKYVDTDLADMTWEEILLEAEGTTLNWYLWGGSTVTNTFIDGTVSTIMKEEYNITVNRIGVSSITEAVNIVLSEKMAGKDEGGTVDVFWLNGSNYLLLLEADATWDDWSLMLPNTEYVDWTDASIANDMGVAVDGKESPWAKAQLQMIYDTATLSENEVPRSYEEFLEYAKANPGKVAYVTPTDFVGTRFIKGAIYELTGGYEQYMADDITKEEFEEMSAAAWDYFEELNQYLWRGGETYPASSSAALELMNNGEIDFAFCMTGMGISSYIASGQIPSTSSVYCMNTSIADTSYLTIPYNGTNKAAAMVLANLLLDPTIQAANISETGTGSVLNPDALSDEQNAIIEEASLSLGAGTYVSAEEKAATSAPEVSSYLNTYIEEIWTERFGS